MLQAAASEVVLEFPSHVVRQRPALPGQVVNEHRVVLFDELIEQGLLGPVALVTGSIPCGRPGRRGVGHVSRPCDTVFSYSLLPFGSRIIPTTAYTFTANGRVATLTDARSYRTAYAYDGFDRRYRRYYPNPTVQNQSSTTDYEQYTYDAYGRRTQERRRNGTWFNFVSCELSVSSGRH